jgi:hypothetical protein
VKMDSGTPQRSHWKPALACFALAFFAFWWLVGRRVDLLNDEGIYLDGARRILSGQAPYRDFFALTGPGVFWNLALVFRLFGMSFSNARLVLVFDLALLAGGLFWLAAQLTSRRVAAILTFGFVSFLAGNLGMLKVTHRWDSSAMVLAAVVLLWAGWKRGGNSLLLMAAGAAAGYAAWCTPSTLAVLAATAIWMVLQSGERRRTLPFLLGIALISASAVVWLAAHRALLPMIEALLWTSRNYSGANQFPYGGIPGGYRAVFADASGLELPVRALVAVFIALPALLPPLALGWLLPKFRRRPPAVLLLACAAGLLISCLPRWDLDHLEYVEPIFLVLAGAWIAEITPPRVLSGAGVVFTCIAALFLFTAVSNHGQTVSIRSRRGLVQGSPADLALIDKMLGPLPAGDGLFVYPYLPTFYFFTDAVNPTRYSFLQPGMMTDDDEGALLAELEGRPPTWVIYNDLPVSEILRVFPSSDPKRLRFLRLEAWLKGRYEAVPGVPADRGIELRKAIAKRAN